MNCLIIGGTSGLGLSLAKKLTKDYKVYVTGRREFTGSDLHFCPLDLSEKSGLNEQISTLVAELPTIDLLIYAAGYFQDGTVTDLSVNQVDEMLNVGLVAAIYVSREIVCRQDSLPEFVAITSTSQWTPRLKEPIYTAVKAGLGAYANSLSLDPRVGKVLVAGPGGMATNFWKGTDKKKHDTSQMLDPDWVADAVQGLRKGQFSYKFARILRQPARVEVQETRE
jgi:short-subunit dehydrogenase